MGALVLSCTGDIRLGIRGTPAASEDGSSNDSTPTNPTTTEAGTADGPLPVAHRSSAGPAAIDKMDAAKTLGTVETDAGPTNDDAAATDAGVEGRSIPARVRTERTSAVLPSCPSP